MKEAIKQPAIVTKPAESKPKQEAELVQAKKPVSAVILETIAGYKPEETNVPLYVIVRGAIANHEGLDVSQFTLLSLMEYLIATYDTQGKGSVSKILFPLTTEYTASTVGAEPWDYKQATLKIINSIIEALK